MELIFRKFTELGSARQVFFWLDRNQIRMPAARGPQTSREVVWQPARYHAVNSILKKHVYAGAYAYGQSKTTVRLEDCPKDCPKQVCRSKQPPQEDWAVLITEQREVNLTGRPIGAIRR